MSTKSNLLNAWANQILESNAEAELARGDEDDSLEKIGGSLEEKDDEPTSPVVKLPTFDDTDRAIRKKVVTYPDWKPEDTFVCSGPLPTGGGPGTQMPSVLAAAVHVIRMHGKILERVKDAEKGGRWAFRVPLPKGKVKS